jgi:predicted Zn-dependent protease
MAAALIVPNWAQVGGRWAESGAPVAAAAAQDEDEELEALLEELRSEADGLRRSGEVEAARETLRELLGDEPGDWQSRVHLAALELDLGNFEAALEAARRVQSEASAPQAPAAQGALVIELSTLLELGRYAEGLERLQAALANGTPGGAAIHELGARLALGAGQRERGLALRSLALERPAGGPDASALPRPGGPGLEALWRSRALRASGELGPASNALVEALNQHGQDAELMAELAGLYLEADGEVDDERTAGRNPGPLLRKALEQNPRSEAALLGLYELHRFNWRRQSQSAESYLAQLLEVRPRSIAGLISAAESALVLSQQDRVRSLKAELDKSAPGQREVRTLGVALAYIDLGPERAEELLAELETEDPEDSNPRRSLGGWLLELYRFAEARPLLERAVEIDAGDYRAWTLLGKAQANTGAIGLARSSLERAKTEARLRRNAERNNLSLVLKHIDESFREFVEPTLTFAWIPEGSEVLELYWPPFYEAARRELIERYGFDPGPVRIEVFERHGDFSVRSTGYEGFPALGVCFGPVVTAVSPLSELRGTFSWARTGFHEFTHVIHLGLSHNRCPRWITEGLATWEEVRRRPAWTRNMRRELLDAKANGEIFPLRDLNAAFRGSRILFGYYQGGLMCDLLIRDFGFPAMLRLLAEFDRGADLDQAMRAVFGLTPEQIDARFAEYVNEQVAGLALEPNWNPERATWLRLGLGNAAPSAEAERETWAQNWCTVAWSAFQQGRRVDAEEALRSLQAAGLEPLRSIALRGHLALAARELSAAKEHFERLFAAGGEDYFGRLALAEEAFKSGREGEAEAHLERAEAAFPGFPSAEVSAELARARFYAAAGKSAQAIAAKERWLDWNADALAERLEVARALAQSGRHEAACVRFEEAVEIDPFLRALHRDYGQSLLALQRYALARREFQAAQRVPAELDGDELGPLEGALLAELAALEGQALLGLGDLAGAEAALARAQAADSSAAEIKRLRAQLKERPAQTGEPTTPGADK